MVLFHNLDSYLIDDVVQPVSDKLVARGINPYRISLICLQIMIFMLLVRVGLMVVVTDDKSPTGFAIVGAILDLIFASVLMLNTHPRWEKDAQKADRGLATMSLNTSRTQDETMRVVLLVLGGGTEIVATLRALIAHSGYAINWLNILFTIAAVFGYYMHATTLNPTRRKK